MLIAYQLVQNCCTLLVCICAFRQSLQLSHRSSRYEEHRFQLFRIWEFYNCLGILHTVELWGAPCGCDSDISQLLNQTVSRKYLMMTTSTRKGRHWDVSKTCLRLRVLKKWGGVYQQGMVDVLDISISKLLGWIILTGWVLEMQEAGRQISLLTLPSWSTLDCLTSWTSWNNKTPKLGTPSSTQDHA